MKKLFAFLLVVCALPLAAQSNDISLWVTSQMNDKGGRFASDEDVAAKFENGNGYGVSASHMFGTRVSGELAIFKTSSGAKITSGSATLADLGDVELTPITAMVRYHFLPGRTIDVYAGAGVAQVLVNDLDSADLRSAGLAPVSLDDKSTWTIGAGLTIGLSSHIGIGVDARYLPMKLSGHAAGDTDRLSTDLNPILLSLGLKFRF